MKFVSFRKDNASHFGIQKGDGVIDISARLGTRYASLQSFIASADWRQVAEQLLSSAPIDLPCDGLQYLPVIPNAAKILCVALNYRDHVEEANRALPGGREVPKFPNTFIRFADSFVGHRQDLVRPKVSTRFDYEAELCVVIGKTVPRHIAREAALQYVFGYSAMNEGSIRDYQFHNRQLTPGKNFSSSGSIGPCIVTADEVGDPQNLDIEFRLNGTVLQHANTSDMIFSVVDLIHYFAQWTTLNPGDLIASGTMGGVGFTRDPPIFMKPGDVAEVAISRVGTLVNGIRDE